MFYTDCRTNEVKIESPPFAYVRAMKNNSFVSLPKFDISKKVKLQTHSNLYRRVTNDWAESFIQLKESQKRENYNADVEMPSEDTIAAVMSWINKAFDIASDLQAPDIVPDAEGGLDIEWTLENKFISIHIDHSDKQLNRIFVKEGKNYNSKPLTEDNLKTILS